MPGWVFYEGEPQQIVRVGADPHCEWQVVAAGIAPEVLRFACKHGLLYFCASPGVGVRVNGVHAVDGVWLPADDGMRLDAGATSFDVALEHSHAAAFDPGITQRAATFDRPTHEPKRPTHESQVRSQARQPDGVHTRAHEVTTRELPLEMRHEERATQDVAWHEVAVVDEVTVEAPRHVQVPSHEVPRHVEVPRHGARAWGTPSQEAPVVNPQVARVEQITEPMPTPIGPRTERKLSKAPSPFDDEDTQAVLRPPMLWPNSHSIRRLFIMATLCAVAYVGWVYWLDAM